MTFATFHFLCAAMSLVALAHSLWQRDISEVGAWSVALGGHLSAAGMCYEKDNN